MTTDFVLGLAQKTLATGLYTSAPLLGVGMVVGVVVAVFQAATQIQESSLNFVPKLIAIGLGLLLFGSWMLDELMSFTVALFTAAAQVGG
jgi:flagellar biosynthetic protein FliQ